MIEECGEHAEGKVAKDVAAIVDALSDALIFSANYCTHNGWDLSDLWETRHDPQYAALSLVDAVLPWYGRVMVALGRLAHHRLKSEQRIRGSAEEHAAKGKDAMRYLLLLLGCEASYYAVELVPAAFKVWREVVQPRQWNREV